jgi:tetratricopeptide (TPR) repeat protein
VAPAELAPSEPAAAPPETKAPAAAEPSQAAEEPGQAAEEPSADLTATAEATAAAESDPDAEDADVEIDASRKAVAARADKLVNEGHALRRKNKLVPARAKYRDALALYPGFPRAIAGLVQVSIQQRDGKAAVNLAKQLVKLRPGQISYLVLLGDSYRVAGKMALAKETWKDAARKGSATAKARLSN